MKIRLTDVILEKRRMLGTCVFFVLIFSSIVLYYHRSIFPELCSGDEALTALRTRGLMEMGHGWTPYWCGAPDLHKPPLYYWFAALSCKVLGCKVSALRLPSVLALFLLSIFVYLLSLEVFHNRLSGYLSVFFMVFHPLVLEQSRIAMLDTLMVALSMGALFFLIKAAYRDYFYYPWAVLCGLAILTKGEGATPVIVISFVYLLMVRRKVFFSKTFYFSVILGTVLPAAWFISQYVNHPQLFMRFHYKDFVTYRFKHKSVFLYHKLLFWLWSSWEPLSLILFASPLVSIFCKKVSIGSHENRNLVLVLSILIPFFMVSLVRQQEVWYIFPMIPPMAMFAGDAIVGFCLRPPARYGRILLGAFLALGCWETGVKVGNHFLLLREEFLVYFVSVAALVIMVVVIIGKGKKIQSAMGIMLVFLTSLAFLGINAPKFRRTALSYMHRDATRWKDIGIQLRSLKKVETPIVINFRYFPRNVIMFYSQYNSIQLRRFSHKVIFPGEVYYGVLLMVPTCYLFLKGLQVHRIRQFASKCPIDILKIENVSSHPVVPCTGRSPSLPNGKASFLFGILDLCEEPLK